MEQFAVLAPHTFEPTEVGTFKVVVLYEDFSTGLRGKQIADFVTEELGTRADPDLVLWNINLIQEPRLNDMAADQAEDAELIILSLRDGFAFSLSTRAFVNRWLEKHTASQAALIAVFENDGPATDFARRHLENAARRAHLEFLTQTVDLQVNDEGHENTELFWIM